MNTSNPAIEIIEQHTRAFARLRDSLQERISELDAELAAVRRRRLRGIRSALARAQDAQGRLEALIKANPDSFVKPRTITIEGIKVGLAKGKGQISWDNEEQVIKLIDRHFPDLVDTLVKVTRKPVKTAIANLTTAELKKLGCRVEESGDQVVIKPQDSELDKLVNRLLDESRDLEEEE